MGLRRLKKISQKNKLTEDSGDAIAIENQIKGILTHDLKHLKAFSHLSSTMREQLANIINFQFFERAGEIVFKQGDVGTSWYVIYKGSVDVVVNGVTVASLGEGDGFGELALINDKPRAASIITREDGCQFIVVEKKNYLAIQEEISSNTVKLEEHGKVVLILEKREKKKKTTKLEMAVQPEPEENKKESILVVVAGTLERLVQHLCEEQEEQFILDFLMSYRNFMTPTEFWERIQKHYEETKATNDQRNIEKRNRIILLIEKWVRYHPSDFRNEPELQGKLQKFSQKIKSEKIPHNDRVQAAITYNRLDGNQKGRSNSFSSTLPKSFGDTDTSPKRRGSSVSEMMRKSLNLIRRRKEEGKHVDQDMHRIFQTLVPSTQWIKIFLTNEDYKTLSVSPTTSAHDIITLALEKFRINDSSNDYVLCEVKLNGTTREFKSEEISILSQTSKNARLYLRKHDFTGTFPPPPLPERSEKNTLMFLETNVEEMARVMTLLDYELFSRIDPLEYFHSVTKTKNQNVSNLNTFVNRFNEINMWVITEICTKDTLQKRFTTVKKFMELANVLIHLKNFNSAFAILSGLGNVAVTRMTQTWKKLSANAIAEFERLQQMMDPSRNMRKYRNILLATEPPLIPFFPIFMKDVFFINDCNPSTVENGLINFEKYRMINELVRMVEFYRSVPYDHILKPYSVSMNNRNERKRMSIVADSNPEKPHSPQEIAEFLAQLYFIDDNKVLTKMSHDIEPKVEN